MFYFGVFLVRVLSFVFLSLHLYSGEYEKQYMIHNLCGKLERM